MSSFSDDRVSTQGTPTQVLNLVRLREQSGVTLEEIVARTKISLRFLEAIEAEDFDKLPGGIFTTSYLRQYAAAIGQDEDVLVAHYFDKTNPDGTPSKGPRRENGGRSILDRWLRMPA